MSNQLYNIQAYKKGKTWLFDDESRQIKGEPFVLGASEFITKLAGKKRKLSFTFSEDYIPEYDAALELSNACYPTVKKGKKYVEDKSQEPTSGWYISEDGDRLWLCPAQLKFFGHVAETIFVKLNKS